MRRTDPDDGRQEWLGSSQSYRRTKVILISLGLALVQLRPLVVGRIGPTSTAVLPSSSCNRVVYLDNADPGKVNQLRRKLASNDPSCYEHHLSAFVTYFRNRLDNVKKHLNLHIPKSGGSSLCQLARSSNKTTPPGNCYQRKYFIPLWCCYKWLDRPNWPKNNSCDALDEQLHFGFTMNENYFDYPLCMNSHLYSILLRAPTDRAMSQERHFMSFSDKNMSMEAAAGRLEVIRKNYMSWSLTSGLVASESRLNFVPTRKHLSVAKDTISRLDFLLELAPPKSSKVKPADANRTRCLPTIMKFMGFGNATMNNLNVAKGRGNTLEYNRSQYYKWNILDVELYRYAVKLAKLDCDFYIRIEEGNHS